jgi:hypothetical protein
MPGSKFFSKFQLPEPGPYDLVSTDAEVADYRALKKKVLADEVKRKHAQRKLYLDMGLPASAIKGMRLHM